MQRVPVESSALRAAVYEEDEHSLYLRFHSGEVYRQEIPWLTHSVLSYCLWVNQGIKHAKPEKVLIDTSPFFGGATHLAWVAADALIIPVRVDQHSIEALRLTLRMLTDPNMDFQKFNAQAGIKHTPKVHAIVMTHCGWNRQKPNSPDSSTRFFVEQALATAQEFASVFSDDDVSRRFYLLDDFHSSGRISGNQRIPLARLHSGKKYVVERPASGSQSVSRPLQARSRQSYSGALIASPIRRTCDSMLRGYRGGNHAPFLGRAGIAGFLHHRARNDLGVHSLVAHGLAHPAAVLRH